MALPGFKASNIAQNVSIGHGVKVFFMRDGTTTWLNLGDLADVSVTPSVEFLEHRSNHDGVQAVAKRILSDRSISIQAVLNEINIDNLRLALYGGAAATGSLNVISTSVPKRTASDTFVLPEAVESIISITSTDGDTAYVETTDWTLGSDGVTISIVASSSLDTDLPNEGDQVHVVYQVQFASADTRKIEILDQTTIEGQIQFQIRNNEGGLAQIIELDLVQISPNGAIPVPPDAIQNLPLTITGQVLNGNFGRVYVKNVA